MSDQQEQPSREEIVRKLMLFRQIVAQSEADDRERTKVEDELWRTEPLTRAVIENSPIGITVRSPAGQLLLFNDAWLRIWGLTAARARTLDRETEGLPIEQRYSYLGRWTEQVRQAFEQGREVFVPEVSLEDYSPRSAEWVSFHFYPIRDPQGRVEQVVTMTHDITDRKRAELALEAARGRLEALLRSTPAVIFSCRADDGTATFISDNVRQELGYSAGEWLADPAFWRERIHPEERAAMAATGLPFPAARAALKEYRFRHADGIYRWLSEESNPIPGAADGPREVAGYFIDITARKLAEQTLRESEQRFRTLIDAVRDIVFTCHSSGTITSLNPAYEAATGWPNDGLIGRPLVALVHPDDMAVAGERAAAGLRGELPPPFEAKIVPRQGDALTFEFQVTPQLKDGAVAGLLGVARDVTARKRAEQELRASEALSRAVIEHSPIGISVRTRTGKLLTWNRAWQELWAMTDEDIRRDRDTERPELVFDAKDNYLRDWLPRVEQVYRVGGTLFIPELKITKPAFGGDRYITQYFYAIPDAGGAVERVVVITQDITERRLTLQEITILAQAVKSATECISITDEHDILLFVNDAFCRTYGYDRSELIGRHIGMVVSPRQSGDSVADVLQRTREGGWRGELLDRRKDGSDFPVHLSTAVVRDELGAPVALIGVARDITEQKRAEAQREKLREAMLQSSKLEAMSTMAGGVAHDFNNLLTVIQGGAELLRIKLPGDDPLLADAERIGRAASRAAGLTRQLLQFSRRQPLDLAACNVEPVAEQSAQKAREKAPAGVQLETMLAQDLWPAQGQAAGMTQVLDALLTNALEAVGDRGRVALTAANCELGESASATMPESRPGRFVRLSVSDSGPGIPPQAAARIFEPFFSTKGPGRGLGLSAAHGIVKQFGGWIEFAGGTARGAEFSVYLPEHVAAEGCPAAAEPVAAPGQQQLVLMVEDEPGIMKVFASILRMKGYQVLEAADVAAARRQFAVRSAEIDLVFSDVLLPDGNGLDLVQGLIAAKPGLRVVLTSGFAGDDERLAKIRELGMPFLPKPYNLHALLQVLGEALAK